MEKKKILIIGGTGFIGYHLAKKCLQKNWNVTSISTSRPKKIRFLKKVNYLICNISQFKVLKKTIKSNFDYVVNLGGYVDHSKRKKIYLSHYIGLKNLTKIFLKNKIKHFIQIGSGGEYGNIKSPHVEKISGKPKSYYYKAKQLASNHLLKLYRKYFFPITVLRLYQVYGPRQDVNRLIPIVIINSLKNKNFACSHGNQFRNFIYISDVIDAIIECIYNRESIGEIINIGSNKNFKIKSIINKICKKIGGGKPIFGKIKLRKEEMKFFFPSVKKARKIITWKPKISFNKGINSTIIYYKKNAEKF